MQITDNLEIVLRDNWLEILSQADNQFVSIGFDEIDALIDNLNSAKTQFSNALDTRLKYGEIIQVLNKEEDWCITHSKNVDPEYRKGFMAGIQQAKRLITGLMSIERGEGEAA